MKILESILCVLWVLLLGLIWAVVLNGIALFVLVGGVCSKILKCLRNERSK
jgi:hypothetical protein